MAITSSVPVELPSAPRWALDEYHRAIEAGIFGDRRIQLLHGELFEMPPMSDPHVGAVRYLSGLLVTQLGWERVGSQTPIILPSDGEPEPDVAVFAPGAPLKPMVDQVQLVVEISQTSRRRDLGSKLEDYLRDGLHELWIIDLVEQCALVYRGGVLFARHARGAGAQLSPELVPEINIDLDVVFQAARLPIP